MTDDPGASSIRHEVAESETSQVLDKQLPNIDIASVEQLGSTEKIVKHSQLRVGRRTWKSQLWGRTSFLSLIRRIGW